MKTYESRTFQVLTSQRLGQELHRHPSPPLDGSIHRPPIDMPSIAEIIFSLAVWLNGG